MGSLTVQRALFDLAYDAHFANGNVEEGGVVVQKTDGTYAFIKVASALNSQCQYQIAGGYPYVTNDGSIVVAYAHTHSPPGTTLSCPVEFPSNPARTAASGPSDADWDRAYEVMPMTNTNYAVSTSDPAITTNPGTIFNYGYESGAQVTRATRDQPSKPTMCAVF
jgi:hypothetical protein